MLPPPEYGSINVTLASVAIGDSVEYTCNSGYELQGASVLTCQEWTDDSYGGGYWNGVAPLCNSTETLSSSTLRISIAVAILAVFVICVVVICVLAGLLAYRTHMYKSSSRFSRTAGDYVAPTATVNPIMINGSPCHTSKSIATILV